jgi:hypothetical protein
MVAAITMLVGITGAVYGPMINRALKRDANNPEAYDAAAAMLPTGSQTNQKTLASAFPAICAVWVRLLIRPYVLWFQGVIALWADQLSGMSRVDSGRSWCPLSSKLAGSSHASSL